MLRPATQCTFWTGQVVKDSRDIGTRRSQGVDQGRLAWTKGDWQRPGVGPHTCSSAVSGGPSIALADLFAACAAPVLTLCVLCTEQCCTTTAVAD
jgi:hypothetical protein